MSGPFRHAQDVNGEYLLRLSPERLLAPFYREAGLPQPEPSYGNWESQGLDGHTAGHFLSATALMYASTGRAEYLRKARTVVDGIARAQDALGTGYVGGVPDGAQLWADISEGGISPDAFSLDGRWVPWYNLHKTFAGLIEAHRSAGIVEALPVVLRLADWWIELAKGISDDDFERMLDTEFGGMNESFADLARITGRAEYLDMAKRFSHHVVLDPLVAHEDHLTGLHANTQIPKALGYLRTGEAGGGEPFSDAARFFADTVIQHRTAPFGGHGVREHFHDPGDFSPIFEDREGPESCNTVNMVRLAGDLYAGTGDASYLDYVETALTNHVLSAQHPEHGGFVYFTPLRPGHYRVYSQTENSFWCCVGTGMEAHARHGAYAYATRGEALLINLFMDSEVDRNGLVLRQRVERREGTHVSVTVRRENNGVTRTIGVRIPGWVQGLPRVFLNGRSLEAKNADGYVLVNRQWTEGDTLEVHLPSRPRFERMPDKSDWINVVDGAVVYAAKVEGPPLEGLLAGPERMGHIARGALMPLAQAPLVPAGSAHELVSRGEGETLTLQTTTGEISLHPFAQLHDSRYVMAFPQLSGSAEERLARLRERDAWQLGLDARTRDSVTFGEQQPESDHAFSGNGTEQGRTGGATWRRGHAPFSVRLMDWLRIATSLRVTLVEDVEVDYTVLVNDVEVWHARRGIGDAVGGEGSRVRVLEFALPAEARAQDPETLRVAFVPRHGRRTDRIVEARLLSK